MARNLDERTAEILAAATVEGNALRLPPGQLARDEYIRVNKVLENLGGKWNRKAGAHVFQSDPAEALATVLDTGKAPLHVRASEGYVATPDWLATEIVKEAGIGDLPRHALVLEPSAGDGSFVSAIFAANPGVRVFAVEPNQDRSRRINQDAVIFTTEFEGFAAYNFRRFDAVVMNPPFAVPGRATIWIDHVTLAWSLLAPGGRLTAIVPAGFIHRQDKRHNATRDLVEDCGGWRELPSDAFESQGTGVRTVLIWITKPEAVSDVH